MKNIRSNFSRDVSLCVTVRAHMNSLKSIFPSPFLSNTSNTRAENCSGSLPGKYRRNMPENWTLVSRRYFPGSDPEQFSARVFDVFDKNGDGKIDFKEFMCA